MIRRFPVIVAYDISDKKARQRVFRILKDWRIEGQKSVAECYLSYREAEELFIQLSEEIDTETDRLAVAWLHQPRRIKWLGEGRSSFPDGLWGIKT